MIAPNYLFQRYWMEFEKSFPSEEATTQDNTLKPTHYHRQTQWLEIVSLIIFAFKKNSWMTRALQ